MNYLALLKYLPLIFSTVKAIESALPDSPGKQKLDAAISFITAAEASIADAVPALTSLVSGVVSAYNASGVFAKKSA